MKFVVAIEGEKFEFDTLTKAKAKYNEQWIEITGKVLDADNVAGMTRFYLYGKSGDSG